VRDSTQKVNLAEADADTAKNASDNKSLNSQENLTGDAIDTSAISIKKSSLDSIANADVVLAVADTSGKRKKPSPFLADSALYLNETGGFIRRNYEPKFSLDNVNAALGIDNYYGTAGQAFVTLSDLMGDQKISFALAVNGSIENTNGFLMYEYLPYKPDFTVALYHEAQQTGSSIVQVDSNEVFSRGALDRRYGFQMGMRYPFSPFTRLQLDLRTLFTERTYDAVTGEDEDSKLDPISIDAFFPSLTWVHDNTQWGIVGPVNGRRLLASVQAVPPLAPLFEEDIGYVLGQADIRQYWEFFKRYTLALRVSAGASEAILGKENPHSFVVGGESFTFNAHFNEENLPTNLRDFYFADLDFPLRGFDFYEFRGTRKLITNAEFRFPFLRELSIVWPIPLSLRHVMGTVFMDYGGAWSTGNAFDQMGMGLGYGFRMNLGIFVLKYTWSKSLDLGVGRIIPTRVYWSLGAEF
jgi:outer membrane protein assembly factor BamA